MESETVSLEIQRKFYQCNYSHNFNHWNIDISDIEADVIFTDELDIILNINTSIGKQNTAEKNSKLSTVENS